LYSGDRLDILIFLVAVVAAGFWVKHKYPDSSFGQFLNSLNPQNQAVQTEIVDEPALVVPEAAAQVETQIEPQVVESVVLAQPVTVAPVVIAESNLNLVPEDSVLKRHYLAQRAAERLAITHPYPTDSTLRRHYESRLHYLTAVTTQPQTSAELVAEPATTVEVAETPVQPAPIADISEPHTELVAVPNIVAEEIISAKPAHLSVPEDSQLKRHFLTQLRAEIESAYATKPADSTLRRHYESLVDSAVNQRLNAL
jgi:hypothetical protein